MAIKSVSIRIEEEMLEKLGFVADYEGRSVNSHILVLIRENIKAYEQEHGEIDGSLNFKLLSTSITIFNFFCKRFFLSPSPGSCTAPSAGVVGFSRHFLTVLVVNLIIKMYN